jgi:DNA-binding transcriptional regulator YhcF (GntR family)
MRFWITKNDELSVHEQLVRQVLLGILSHDLPPGQKLPSVRALARRHQIHPNTVSGAYHDLLGRGWLELRRGSGLYVRPLDPAAQGSGTLDQLLVTLLQAAHGQGHEPGQVLARLEQLVRPRAYERIVVAEPEPAMREILQAELASQLPIFVEAMDPADFSSIPEPARCLFVALATRAPDVRRSLPDGVSCIALRLRSVRESLEQQSRPEPNTVISIASRSAEIRHWSRAILIAVGLDPERLCEVDANLDGWKDRLALSSVVVTDILTARALPKSRQARVFRVIADSSLEELKQLSGV